MQKKVLVALLALCLHLTLAFSQNYLSLDQVIDLANCKTYNRFDEKARLYGFNFSNRAADSEGHSEYVYLKEIDIKTISYTNALSYTEYGDGKPRIAFVTTIIDLLTIYRRSLSRHALLSVDCPTEPEADETAFCYKSQSYYLKIKDSTGDDNGRTYRKYVVTIFRR